MKDVVIAKSLDPYGEVYPTAGPVTGAVHVVEESMAPVAQVVSVKDADEMFKLMFKKGLLRVDQSGIFPTEKFYQLLGSFVEQSFNDIMKSASPHDEKTEEGASLVDVLYEANTVLKSAVGGDGAKSVPEDGVGSEARPSEGSAADKAPDLALSQEEADNKNGDGRTDSVPEDGTGSEARADGSEGTPAKLALSQEQADNKNGNNTAISDAEALAKFGKVQVMKASESVYLFKSLGDFTAASRKVSMRGRASNYDERKVAGSKWAYAGEILEPTAPVGRWGNKKV